METITSKQGEMWDMLSIRAYGSAAFMDELIKANPEHRKVVMFRAGVVLSVPLIDTTLTASSLPPWKRKVTHG